MLFRHLKTGLAIGLTALPVPRRRAASTTNAAAAASCPTAQPRGSNEEPRP